MENQNFFDKETAEMLEKIEEETKKILAGDYEKIEREIREEAEDYSDFIN